MGTSDDELNLLEPVTPLDSFVATFNDRSGGCYRQCHCGKRYYHDDDFYDWEDGEIEELRADAEAVSLREGVSTLTFEGREYVIDCKCWRERAEMIIRFLKGHGKKICDFFVVEKDRLQAAADAAPTPGKEHPDSMEHVTILAHDYKFCSNCGSGKLERCDLGEDEVMFKCHGCGAFRKVPRHKPKQL